jgi:hypothetical protein
VLLLTNDNAAYWDMQPLDGSQAAGAATAAAAVDLARSGDSERSCMHPPAPG